MLTNALSGKTPSFNGHPLHATESGLLRRNHRRAVSESNAPNIRRSLAPVDPEASNSLVAISPVQHVRRRVAKWSDITAEIVQATSSERTEYHYRGPRHLLVLFDQLVRRDGATSIEGLRTSSLRDLTRKLIFVPAGCEFSHWHEARSGGRVVLFYFDPDAIPLDSKGDAGDQPSEPRLFFEDAALLSTTGKLASLLEGPHCGSRDYVEALGRVLAHELVRMQQGQSKTRQILRGGLASWQQRVVTTYIDEHLAEPISLATLAELAGLSAYHFCRAFKQSFGLPPHRYHTAKRIEHAKTLLAKHAFSVTDIGMRVGFAETSSFTAAFRKATGVTPSTYHRGLL
jgi:AraC family transcriptional regulator